MKLLCSAAVAILLAAGFPAPSTSEESAGSEIKLGVIASISGSGSERDMELRVARAWFDKIDHEGGLNGRMIRTIVYNDQGDLKQSLHLAKKLVEVDGVSLIFRLAPGTREAIGPYLRFKKIPSVFEADQEETASTPPRAQAELYGNYVLRKMPGAKIAVLYEDDRLGNELLDGFVAGLGAANARRMITNIAALAEPRPAGNQVDAVSGHNADILAIFGEPGFQLRLLQQMTELRWRPVLVMNDTVTSLDLVQTNPGRILTSRLRRVTNAMSPAELADWDAFRSTYLSSDLATSDVAVDGYRLGRSIVSLLQTIQGQNLPERVAEASRQSPAGGLRTRAVDLIGFNGKTWELVESDVGLSASRNDPPGR